MRTKDIALISVLSCLILVQEEILNFIPNVSFTPLFLMLFSKKFGTKKTLCIIFIYVLLDNLLMNSFNIVYTPFMFIAWTTIPLLLNTIFKNVKEVLKLSIIGFFLSLVYCWIYIIPSVLIYRMDLLSYLMYDISFELIMGISTFIEVLLLFGPCEKVLDNLLIKE